MTFQDRIPLYVSAFGAILVAVGFAMGVETGIGALVGAGVATANAFALRWLVTAMLKADPERRAGMSLTLMLKTAVILGLAAALLFFAHIDPIGFAIGIGALVLGLVLGSAHHNLTAAPPAGGPASATTKGE
ncbi:MAG: ATP synthase subunit I [Sandaracinus sp.]